MKPSRSTRFLTAVLAIFSMLYMQLAMASYVCPGMTMGSQAAMASPHAMAADMSDCEGMDRSQPTLCHLDAHGDSPTQSLDKTPPPDVPPFVPAALIADLQFLDVVPVPDARPYLPIVLMRTTAPPIAIRNCCFRV